MTLRVHADGLQKAGNSEAEYEDALALRCGSRLARPRAGVQSRVAIADGATDSWCSGLWAALLANAGAGRGLDPEYLAPTFERLRTRWKAEAVRGDLDWVSEEKARGGGHAAVLWACLWPPEADQPGRWSASAVGDCCVFHLRGGGLVSGFPYTRPDQFTSRPDLLGTNTPPEAVAPLVATAGGEWTPGDTFLFATDALALWFLEQCEVPEAVAEFVRAAAGGDFRAWAAGAREAGRLRNDDTTFVWVETG